MKTFLFSTIHRSGKKYERALYRCRQETQRTVFSVSSSVVHSFFSPGRFLPHWHFQHEALFSAFERAPENVLTRISKAMWTLFLILNPVKIKAIIVYNKVNTFGFVLCIVVARNMEKRDAGSYRSSLSVIHTVFSSSLFLPHWHTPPPTHPPNTAPPLPPIPSNIRRLTKSRNDIVSKPKHSLKHASLSYSWYIFFSWFEDEDVLIFKKKSPFCASLTH